MELQVSPKIMTKRQTIMSNCLHKRIGYILCIYAYRNINWTKSVMKVKEVKGSYAAFSGEDRGQKLRNWSIHNWIICNRRSRLIAFLPSGTASYAVNIPHSKFVIHVSLLLTSSNSIYLLSKQNLRNLKQ